MAASLKVGGVIMLLVQRLIRTKTTLEATQITLRPDHGVVSCVRVDSQGVQEIQHHSGNPAL